MYYPQQSQSTAKLLILPYHLMVMALFAAIYAFMGMQKHFGAADSSPVLPVYFAAVTHTTTGYGDLTPKTDLARAVVVLHLCFAWIPTVVIAVT